MSSPGSGSWQNEGVSFPLTFFQLSPRAGCAETSGMNGLWCFRTRQRTLTTIAVMMMTSAAVLMTMRAGVNGAASGPPERVVEEFVRELAAHRYDRALPYLTKHLLAQTIPLTLEVRMNELEHRTGTLIEVRGVPQWSVDTRAFATAEATSERAGRVTLGFGLVREDDGAWRIEELYELGWKPKGVQ